MRTVLLAVAFTAIGIGLTLSVDFLRLGRFPNAENQDHFIAVEEFIDAYTRQVVDIVRKKGHDNEHPATLEKVDIEYSTVLKRDASGKLTAWIIAADGPYAPEMTQKHKLYFSFGKDGRTQVTKTEVTKTEPPQVTETADPEERRKWEARAMDPARSLATLVFLNPERDKEITLYDVFGNVGAKDLFVVYSTDDPKVVDIRFAGDDPKKRIELEEKIRAAQLKFDQDDLKLILHSE